MFPSEETTDYKSAVEVLMDENIKELNNLVGAYEKIARYKIYPQEFEKTPKKSIKRYLYQNEV